MTETQNIEIEGLPEGWRAVAYRRPIMNVDYILLGGDVILCNFNSIFEYLIIEKTRPRRIVLEETDEVRSPRYGDYYVENEQIFISIGLINDKKKIWRVVKEGE